MATDSTMIIYYNSVRVTGKKKVNLFVLFPGPGYPG